MTDTIFRFRVPAVLEFGTGSGTLEPVPWNRFLRQITTVHAAAASRLAYRRTRYQLASRKLLTATLASMILNWVRSNPRGIGKFRYFDLCISQKRYKIIWLLWKTIGYAIYRMMTMPLTRSQPWPTIINAHFCIFFFGGGILSNFATIENTKGRATIRLGITRKLPPF